MKTCTVCGESFAGRSCTEDCRVKRRRFERSGRMKAARWLRDRHPRVGLSARAWYRRALAWDADRNGAIDAIRSACRAAYGSYGLGEAARDFELAFNMREEYNA